MLIPAEGQAIDVTDKAAVSVNTANNASVAMVTVSGVSIPAGTYTLQATVTYSAGTISGWQSTNTAAVTIYTAPAFTTVHHDSYHLEDGSMVFVFPFELETNSAVLDDTLQVKFQYKNADGDWTDVDYAATAYSQVDNWQFVECSGDRIPVPKGQPGAIYEARLVCTYTYPDGSTDEPVASTQTLYVFRGNYLTPASMTADSKGFEALFTIDPALVSYGIRLSVDECTVNAPDDREVPKDNVTISGADVKVTGSWAELKIDPAQADDSWTVQLFLIADVYGDVASQAQTQLTWLGFGEQGIAPSSSFTAPVPGTPTMEHIDNDDKDQHIINVTAPLTLNSAAAAGSSVTAELGWTSNNTFRAFEYADSAPTYTGDGSTSWSPRIVYDAGAAASDLYAPMILQPAVVRFTYECAGAPADDPGYADTDPFLLYWGNYLSYMYPGKDPDDSIAYFVLDDDFAGSQYIDLANLSIASVQLMEEDGETPLRTLDPSLYSIFREDGMVGMRYSLPDDLPSSYYVLRVTLSYSDSAWGIDNWTSSDGMGFDYEAPAVGDPLFTYVYGYAENADEAIVQAEFGMDLRSAAGLPGTAVLQRWSGPLLGIGKYQFEDTNFTVDYDSDDRDWNEYIFGGFPMDYGFAGTFRIAYYYTDSDGESRAVYSNEFLVYTGTFIGQGDFTYGNGYFGGSSELLFGLSFSDLTNVTITVYDDNREPVDISGLTPRGGGDWIGFEFTENIPALPAGEYTVLITADFVMGEYDIWTGEGTAFFTVS